MSRSTALNTGPTSGIGGSFATALAARGYGLKHPFLDNDIEDEQARLDVLVTAVLRLPRGTYSAAKAYVTSSGWWWT